VISIFERRDGLVVSGADAGKYLHSQLSNEIASLGRGESTYAFALDPNGKVVALCRVLRVDEHEFLIDVDRGAGEALLARLLRFRIRVDVTIETRELGVWCVRGDVSEVSGAGSPTSGAIRASAWWSDGTAIDFIEPLDNDVSSRPEDAAGELEKLRVRARWPRHGAEIVTGETLPAATGVVPIAVSFTKGCYPGQELVERMDSRGATAPFVLRDIDVSGYAPGDPYIVDGVEVGRVTSVAGGRALAYVRRDLAQ
jgi:folate-binding protein YgfZ